MSPPKVLEPLRYLTRWLMRRSSTSFRIARRALGGSPPISSLASPCGPAVRVLQYYAALMDDGAGAVPARRLRLLYLKNGFASLQHWGKERPLMLARLRRSIVAASSWIWLRHAYPHQHWPWRLAVLVDRLWENVVLKVNILPELCVAVMLC